MSFTPLGVFVGLSTVDLTYNVAHLPGPDAKVAASSQAVTSGGPAANAAITFAFMGGRSHLITAVGRHPLGEVVRRDLERYSVAVEDIAAARTESPPVSSVLVLPDGQRSIVSANSKVFGPEAGADWTASDVVDTADVILTDGHYVKLCQLVAASARQQKKQVILDGGSWKTGMEALLGSVTAAICSNDFRPPGCSDCRDVFAYLQERGIPRIAITRGENSILFADGKFAGEIPVEPVEAVNTSGAGDVFHGAFCYEFARPQRDFGASLEFAAKLASFSCRSHGTRTWMDTFHPF